MNIEKTIMNYLKYLEQSDYENIIELFTKDALVHSPLSGEVEAKKFYKKLFGETKKSKIRVKNVFEGKTNKRTGAGHFQYTWVLDDGTKTSFECVDIFQFTTDGKIKELKIIYDTYGTRQNYEKLDQ